MSINTMIKAFENDLVNLVNNSIIPIACKEYVIRNVLDEVEKATEKAIAAEAAESRKEDTEDAIPES